MEIPDYYMAELDQWSDANIVGPLFIAAQDYDEEHSYDWESTVERVQKSIREKVLERYRNGQQAGPRKFVRRRPQRNLIFQLVWIQK